MSTLIKSSGRSRQVFQVVKGWFSGSRKNTWKRWIDLALYLVSCVLGGTGLLLAYRLPHGHGEGRMVTFLGYGRHDWGTIHTWQNPLSAAVRNFVPQVGQMRTSCRTDVVATVLLPDYTNRNISEEYA